jgi:RimJ/RimL family protein N-acetyltransferase
MFPSLSEIVTRRCHIAPLTPDDAPQLQAITDASVTARIHFLSEPFTLADAEALIAEDDGHRFLGVWDTAEARLLGVIGVHPRRPREIEVGYWFAAAARGRGLATETVETVVAALASRYPDHRIVAECRPDNRASWKLLSRIGFRPAGEDGTRPGRALLRFDARAMVRFDVC